MDSIENIIEDCSKGKRRAQNLLYKQYAPMLLGVCMRYCRNKSEAEDVLQEGFIKIFANIDKFKIIKGGTFEGWLKRIMVNTALNNYRDSVKRGVIVDIDEANVPDEDTSFEEQNKDVSFSKNEIMKVIQSLPAGYKMVFNLYVFENYSHQEIAVLLNISVNTSKSQLSKARRYLRDKLNEIKQEKYAYSG